jgi:2',3'-cyclic-nucleotide 2'-phosphodiesterase (5'-nucleotidase family)
LRGQGDVLLVDAGNALFKNPGASDPLAKQRAELILQTMGELGTVAMVAGARDFNEGAQFLKENAAKAKVTVLSANLRRAGKPVFPASITKRIGDARVGLIGASPPGKMLQTDLEGLPVREALAEARRLRPKVDVIVLLAAVSYADALQLSKEAGKDVDFILQSNESRGAGFAQNMGDNYVVPTGDRGRQIGRLQVQLAGRGPFVDSDERRRLEQTLENLDRQLTMVKLRQKEDATSATQKALQQTEANFESRRATVQRQLASLAGGSHRNTFTLQFETLGPEVPDDPRLRELVTRLEPVASP